MTGAPTVETPACARQPMLPVGGIPPSDPVSALHLLLPGQPSVQRSIAARLLTLLDERIAQECRVVVDRQLHQMPETSRSAILPAASARADMAAKLLRCLPPSGLVCLLSPAVEEERVLLLRLPGDGDPMLREAALDVLSGAPRDQLVREQLHEGCLELLGPGLALHGADRPAARMREQDDKAPEPATTAREVSVLAALRRDDFDDAVRMLALHSGMDKTTALEAVWARDIRSLLGLSWRAGYSMHAAVLLQTQLAGVPRPLTLGPSNNGGSPMGRGEIAWHLAVLAAR